ncbi:PREDICTED: uncharacterized protein LOC101291024 isoform 2 [Fragaria vesca subsp. vesca]|uniref:uncharacterized protein LOC101291024 n=1 Tax=Fragaria vesca subsp. vesca TaxID=101020 RepID=UPI0002C34FA0|nr:PREDICTED: uncharacterized protein LOC101291024 [Fragaria vesca subsp. vesca]
MEHNRIGVDPELHEKPNTFWTQCHICSAKFQYDRGFVNRVIRCQRCYNIFDARELEGVHQESLRNQFPNHKELPKQCPQSQEPPNTFWTQCPSCSAKFRYCRDTLGLLLSCRICRKAFEPHELKKDVHPAADFSGASNCEKRDVLHGVALGKHGVETLESDSIQSKCTGSSRHMNKKIGNSESGYCLKCERRAGSDPELSGGHCKKYRSKRQNPSSILYDDDDFVRPLKSLRKGQFSGAAKKKRNIAAAGVHKKGARKNVGFPVGKNLQNKKTEDFEEIEVPDPQFHKFVVDADRLASLCEANQIWALYDPADGMPRWYVFVEKVLTTEFKLRIRWLDADPDDHGEINWSKKQLPVACGKFRLRETEEITDHLSFSHKMQYTKGSRTTSVLVYPRRGETWAIYQNWDIGWSSEPETYKYEFVEVLSDFVEGVGIAVTYLGKVKGFVSLFQQTEQQGFQVPPAELYRFSHRIPSFKMTGHEGCGVPSGSFELDPAALPGDVLVRDVDDMDIDN